MINLESINKVINFKPAIYNNCGVEIKKNEINKKLIKTIVPVAIENSLQSVSAIIVMAMIGRLDVVAISSMGIALVVMQVILAIFRGISLGEMVFVSRYYGETNYKKMETVIYQTMLTTIIVAVIVSLILFFYSKELLFIYNVDNEIITTTIVYLKIIAYGLPFLALIIIIGGAFQGIGKSFRSMNIIIVMNVIYTILSYILIFGKFGVHSYGLKGAAIAMVTSQIITAVIGIYSITSKKGILKRNFKNISLRLDFNLIKKVYIVGMSSSLESILWLIAIIIVTAVMLDYGPITFASYQVATNAEAIYLHASIWIWSFCDHVNKSSYWS